MTDWSFDAWPAITPQWYGGGQGHRPDDQLEYHLDLGCGRLKKGRIGVDRFPDPGVNIVADLDRLRVYSKAKAPGEDAPDPYGSAAALYTSGLPFEDSSIKSAITHHFLEHLGEGFVPFMDEMHRVLEPDAPFRIIVPAFSGGAFADADHRRIFVDGSFEYFTGSAEGESWTSCFSTPYIKGVWRMTDKDMSPYPDTIAELMAGVREMRVTLRPIK